jgi:hypothetical protein
LDRGARRGVMNDIINVLNDIVLGIPVAIIAGLVVSSIILFIQRKINPTEKGRNKELHKKVLLTHELNMQPELIFKMPRLPFKKRLQYSLQKFWIWFFDTKV